MTRNPLARILALAAAVGAALVGGAARAEGAACALLDPQLDRSTTPAAACIACHDGSAAPSVTATDSHPVDVSYATAWLEHPGQLHGIIPAELVLPDGRVACVTCHDGASSYRRRIAIQPVRLCTSCHAR